MGKGRKEGEERGVHVFMRVCAFCVSHVCVFYIVYLFYGLQFSMSMQGSLCRPQMSVL